LAQEERLDHQEIRAAMVTILFLTQIPQLAAVVAQRLQMRQEVPAVRAVVEQGLTGLVARLLLQGKAMRVALARLQVEQMFRPLVVEAVQAQ